MARYGYICRYDIYGFFLIVFLRVFCVLIFLKIFLFEK
jgi:hypothetical protein